jgi:hypothetical protein
MSFMMHARPAPVNLPEPTTFVSLKYAVASRWFGHDGSLRGDYITVTKEQLAFLEGIAAAAPSDVKGEARTLIRLIHDNPQGVHVWIGEHDDYDH